jgi:replication-associated recombination protein RarA
MRTNMKGTIIMRSIDRHKPTSLFNIAGNQKAIAKICRVADENNGYDGLSIMLTGRTGNGKTLIADLIAKMVTDEPYRADCTKEAETKALIDQMKRNIITVGRFRVAIR